MKVTINFEYIETNINTIQYLINFFLYYSIPQIIHNKLKLYFL
jgi:hypothetical protein